MLSSQSGLFHRHPPNWIIDEERIRSSWKSKRSCTGPNKQPWSFPRSMPKYHAKAIVAQIHYLMSRKPRLRHYAIHDLYWIGKKPFWTELGMAFDADSIRDISVANWQVRTIEQECAAPVVEVLPDALHPANVGWIKGRLINQPVAQINRRVFQCRTLQQDFAVLLLDFLKAFPSVLLESMWRVMEIHGWPTPYILLFQELHSDMQQIANYAGLRLQGPPKISGLWTGSNASTVLLLELLDVLICSVYNAPSFGATNADGGTIDGFADDLGIFASTYAQMRTFRDKLKDFSGWSGVQGSTLKSVLVLSEHADEEAWKSTLWEGVLTGSVGATLGMHVGIFTLDELYGKVKTAILQAVDFWMKEPLAKSEVPYVYNFFVLSKVSYIAQFLLPPKEVQALLLRSMKKLYRQLPTFPTTLITFADLILKIKPVAYDPYIWNLAVMERADGRSPHDETLAHEVRIREDRDTSIDWQQSRLPLLWRGQGIEVRNLRRRISRLCHKRDCYPLFSWKTSFLGLLWRVYSDGGINFQADTQGTTRACSGAYAIIIVLGDYPTFKLWGRVQINPRGQNYWGALELSSMVAEVSAYLGLAAASNGGDLWRRQSMLVDGARLWPSKYLLLCSDSTSALGILRGSALGATEPALCVHLTEVWDAFVRDRDLEIGLQHTPSHVDIKWNEEVDTLVSRGHQLGEGEFQSELVPYTRLQKMELLPLAAHAFSGPWPDSIANPKSVTGVQTAAYHYWKGKKWLTGNISAVFRKRVSKWAGGRFTIHSLRTIWSTHPSIPPRERWVLYTAILGEWPTGRRTRHITAPRSPTPPCRFCGEDADCVTHWFGTGHCTRLFDMLARNIALPTISVEGWFDRAPSDAHWPVLCRAIYAVHCLLRWKTSLRSELAPALREGIWLTLHHSTQMQIAKSDTCKALKAARKRQLKHRQRKRKKALYGTIQTCTACGQLHEAGRHTTCIRDWILRATAAAVPAQGL
jgi:hypothetical protein